MIVTADPVGDFNATSQILRYSALAREVTVPRIPSVSSTILNGTPANGGSQKVPGDQASVNHDSPDEGIMEMAFSEIARLTEEVEVLGVKLAEQEGRRKEAEEGWQRADEKMEEIERQVREECWSEMERRTGEDRRRWMNAWSEEVCLAFKELRASDTYFYTYRLTATMNTSTARLIFSRKVFKVGRSLLFMSSPVLLYGLVHEDSSSPATLRIEELESENETLRRKLEALERDLQAQSPTRSARKKPPQTPPAALDDCGTTLFKLNALSLSHENGVGSSPLKATPGRKVRKMTARKWDLGDENELEGYAGY